MEESMPLSTSFTEVARSAIVTPDSGSRAGAAALAALPPNPAAGARLLGASTVLGSGAEATAAILGAEIGAAGLALDARVSSRTSSLISKRSTSLSLLPETDATICGCDGGFGVELIGGAGGIVELLGT